MFAEVKAAIARNCENLDTETASKLEAFQGNTPENPGFH